MTDQREKILEAIRQGSPDEISLDEGKNFSENGFDSYFFVETVVRVENVCGVELDDSQLDYRVFETLGEFLNYVEGLMATGNQQ